MSDLRRRLRGRGYLAELRIIIVVALAAGVVVAGLTVYDVVAGNPITVGVDGVSTPGTVDGLRAGVQVDPDAPVQVRVDDPSASQLAWHTAEALPWYLLAMAVLVGLLLIVRDARRDEPFSAANVRRLQVLGWVLTVGAIVGFSLELAAGLALSATVTTGPPAASAPLPLAWCFAGLCLLALSEVVRRGRALREELATVI